MARAAILVCGIAALLALSSCRTPRHTQDAEQKREVPQGVPSPTAAPATTPPAPATVRPTPPTPAPTTAAPVARPTAKQSTATASDTAAPKKAASPPGASVPKAAPVPATPKASSLDLKSLEQRLKDTRAIGVFTKLSLKNQVDDLLSEFREFHKGGAKMPQSELRQKYDLLIIKVLSLLQNGDPQLASAIASSREAIWGILVDPKKFANI